MLSHLKWITLLSLDAPLVAVSWQALFSHSLGNEQQWHHYLVVFLSVWLGYAADRWLDNLKRTRPGSEQHNFYGRHKVRVLRVWILALLIAVSLSLSTLNLAEITKGLALMGASIAYTVFAQRFRELALYPLAKTALTSFLVLAASLLFQPVPSLPPAAILAVWLLFFTNCLLIRHWSRAHEKHNRVAALLTGFGCLCASAIASRSLTASIGYACLLSLLALFALHTRLGAKRLIVRRTLADLCLLTPIPLLFL